MSVEHCQVTEPSNLDFALVPDIHDAHSGVDRHTHLLLPLGSLIRKWGLAESVCPFLIHRHFQIGRHETLTRHYVAAGYDVRPTPIGSGNAICAYVLSVTADGLLRPLPFEYLDENSAPEEALAQCDALARAIAMQAEALVALPKATFATFGLMIVHPDTELGGDHIWIEESESEARLSKTRLVPRSSMSDDEADHLISTAWVFSKDRDPVVSRTCCGPRYRLQCVDK